MKPYTARELLLEAKKRLDAKDVHVSETAAFRLAQALDAYGLSLAAAALEALGADTVERGRLRLADLKRQAELQRRADEALLATYLSVDEIIMHRDRRVELFQAQSRVTELYLRNMMRRMTALREEASRYRPYSEDPNAEMIDPELAEDILVTKATIKRHQANLERFREDEQSIVARFDGDIDRFKMLKGLN
ncbi:MAG: hypothetical protein ACE5KS_00005 [Woeseiaceae bacterium]